MGDPLVEHMKLMIDDEYGRRLENAVHDFMRNARVGRVMLNWRTRRFSGSVIAESAVLVNFRGHEFKCLIHVQVRPQYCDRGRYLAMCESGLDSSEGFPRYYFDAHRMLGELDAWASVRKEIVQALPVSDIPGSVL